MSESKLSRRLLEDVVIFEEKEAAQTGAQSVAPDHSPRNHYREPPPPAPGILSEGQDAQLQQRVAAFLYHQSELLDGKNWQRYIDLFAPDGLYWMPVTPDQTEWNDSPSIFAEDRNMMAVRFGRITHPNAWSQAPDWGTSHVVGNIVIEEVTPAQIKVRSRFHMMELRRDVVRHFAGRYQHTLVPGPEGFRIRLQRVDLLNGQAPFDYVLQAWV